MYHQYTLVKWNVLFLLISGSPTHAENLQNRVHTFVEYLRIPNPGDEVTVHWALTNVKSADLFFFIGERKLNKVRTISNRREQETGEFRWTIPADLETQFIDNAKICPIEKKKLQRDIECMTFSIGRIEIKNLKQEITFSPSFPSDNGSLETDYMDSVRSPGFSGIGFTKNCDFVYGDAYGIHKHFASNDISRNIVSSYDGWVNGFATNPMSLIKQLSIETEYTYVNKKKLQLAKSKYRIELEKRKWPEDETGSYDVFLYKGKKKKKIGVSHDDPIFDKPEIYGYLICPFQKRVMVLLPMRSRGPGHKAPSLKFQLISAFLDRGFKE